MVKGDDMKISARNVLQGSIQRVTQGAVNAEVVLALPGGDSVTAIITNGSVGTLDIAVGKAAYAIMKASEVMIGKGIAKGSISARNVLPGLVEEVHDGAVNSEVIVSLGGGTRVVASITKDSVKSLGLKAGDPVSAIIKASNVMVGVE
jgi:molybdate transport system regulatory protein